MSINTSARRKAPTWTKRDGAPVKCAMTFFPPHQVVWQGETVADYGPDQDAAAEHYERLLARLRANSSNPLAHRVMGGR